MKRDVVKLALEHQAVPYVPWSCHFTSEAKEKLVVHFGSEQALDKELDNHAEFIDAEFFVKDLEQECSRDYFGVVWDRSVDKDIGVVKCVTLTQPSLDGYRFPDPCADRLFSDVEEKIAGRSDAYRIWSIGFSLYERAWALRGMENLMMDFIENPQFVHDLFDAITDWNISQAKKAMGFDIDAVYFGDDWGTQNGLQMGPVMWAEFIKPRLERMYGAVKDRGKHVFIHSCGKVDELFDDLISIGLDCFNPFQPEVMDVQALMKQYHGKLTFHGGLSTQRTLPYGSIEEVRKETQRLLDMGKQGGYIFAPAHAVDGDVPVENMLAFIDVLKSQPGYKK